MGFQLTADAFSYVYAKAILKALELIEQDMNDGNDPRDTWSASERPMMLKRDLPDPIVCDAEYCTVDEPPGCLNFEVSVADVLSIYCFVSPMHYTKLTNKINVLFYSYQPKLISYQHMVTGVQE